MWDQKCPKRKTNDVAKGPSAICLSSVYLNSLGDGKQNSELQDKIEHLKIFINQHKGSLDIFKEEGQAKDGWRKISFIVDSGACDAVVDPRALAGDPPADAVAYKAGVQAVQYHSFREKSVVVCTERGDVRSIEAQRSTVVNHFLLSKG